MAAFSMLFEMKVWQKFAVYPLCQTMGLTFVLFFGVMQISHLETAEEKMKAPSDLIYLGLPFFTGTVIGTFFSQGILPQGMQDFLGGYVVFVFVISFFDKKTAKALWQQLKSSRMLVAIIMAAGIIVGFIISL